MAEPQHYFLKSNNYLRQLTCALDNHRANDEFVDVTLLCEGRKITAHKVVLSSCSSYFKDIFSQSPHPHPLLIFNFIKYEDLNSIIKFMYQGEVNVKAEGLDSFLQLAKMLSVHGLNTESTDNDSVPSNIDNDSIPSKIGRSIAKPVRVLHSTSTGTNIQQKIQTLLKLDHENQAQRNLSTTMHSTPSCSQSSSNKKRKLTDTYDGNDVSRADDLREQAAVNKTEESTKGTTANLQQQLNVIQGQLEFIIETQAKTNGDVGKLLSYHCEQLPVLTLFPIKTKEKLIELNEKISAENRNQYVRAMAYILGKGGVVNNFKYIIDDSVTMGFNVDGAIGKQNLKNLEKFFSALLEAVFSLEDNQGPPEELIRKAIQRQKRRERRRRSKSNKHNINKTLLTVDTNKSTLKL